MVRINLVAPHQLADQHLIAEYNEILMLFGHVAKHPAIRNQPPQYVLGKGHITFFKNKLRYLQKRHERIKQEMHKRGFQAEKTLRLATSPSAYHNDWEPDAEAFAQIKKRLREKLKKKPTWYKYYGKSVGLNKLLSLLD